MEELLVLLVLVEMEDAIDNASDGYRFFFCCKL